MNINEVRNYHLQTLEKENMFSTFYEQKEKEINEAAKRENEILKKRLMQKDEKIEIYGKLLFDKNNQPPKINGMSDNIKDIKAIVGREAALENFLKRNENPKSDLNQTTIPGKQRQLKFWNWVHSEYYSPNWFGALKNSIEWAMENPDLAKRKPKDPTKSSKKQKLE